MFECVQARHHSVSHGNSLYAGIPPSLLYFTLAQSPESARKSGAGAFALLVSCSTCFRFVFKTFVIYLLKVVGFSGWHCAISWEMMPFLCIVQDLPRIKWTFISHLNLSTSNCPVTSWIRSLVVVWFCFGPGCAQRKLKGTKRSINKLALRVTMKSIFLQRVLAAFCQSTSCHESTSWCAAVKEPVNAKASAPGQATRARPETPKDSS